IPTEETTARNKSGCCVIIAPINRPPLLPPWIASFSGRVYFSLIRYSSAAANVCDHIDAAAIEPEPPRKIETRRHADSVAAVCIKQRRILPITLRSFPEENIQRDFCAVF